MGPLSIFCDLNSAWTINEPHLPEKDLDVMQSHRHLLANGRPSLLCWEVVNAISCTKCNWLALSRKLVEGPQKHHLFVLLPLEDCCYDTNNRNCHLLLMNVCMQKHQRYWNYLHEQIYRHRHWKMRRKVLKTMYAFSDQHMTPMWFLPVQHGSVGSQHPSWV